MKGRDCETIRDLLPEFGAGSMAPEERRVIEAHLATCQDCEQELGVLTALRDARPEVPPGLEARIQARIRAEMAEDLAPAGAETRSAVGRRVIPIPSRWRSIAPAWALSAAAIVILALGTAVIWNRSPMTPIEDPIQVASQEPLPEAWLWDDGMVAGAPVFDGLSDEDLEALLKELEG
jgi:anti-sigma factor RsiW